MSEWIVRFLSDTGYPGIIALMVLENIFPPIPSELIMTFAGFAASKGNLSLPAVISAGTLGSTIGTTFWYLVARHVGLQRIRQWVDQYERILTLSTADIDGAEVWFTKRGRLAVLVGRAVPTVRTLISVPAGLLPLPFSIFLAYTMAGTLAWNASLASAGYWLGEHYSIMGRLIDPMAALIVAGAVIVYAMRLLRGRARRN